MKKISLFSLIFSWGVFVAGCVTIPQVITSEDQLVTGLKKEPIEAILGKPYSQSYSEVRFDALNTRRVNTRHYYSKKTHKVYTIVYHNDRAHSIDWQDMSWKIRKKENEQDKAARAHVDLVFENFIDRHKDYFTKYPNHLSEYKRFLIKHFYEWPVEQVTVEFLNVAFWQFLEKNYPGLKKGGNP